MSREPTDHDAAERTRAAAEHDPDSDTATSAFASRAEGAAYLNDPVEDK